jgi:hypothetical protein
MRGVLRVLLVELLLLVLLLGLRVVLLLHAAAAVLRWLKLLLLLRLQSLQGLGHGWEGACPGRGRGAQLLQVVLLLGGAAADWHVVPGAARGGGDCSGRGRWRAAVAAGSGPAWHHAAALQGLLLLQAAGARAPFGLRCLVFCLLPGIRNLQQARAVTLGSRPYGSRPQGLPGLEVQRAGRDAVRRPCCNRPDP